MLSIISFLLGAFRSKWATIPLGAGAIAGNSAGRAFPVKLLPRQTAVARFVVTDLDERENVHVIITAQDLRRLSQGQRSFRKEGAALQH